MFSRLRGTVKTDVIVVTGWIIDGFVEYHPGLFSCSVPYTGGSELAEDSFISRLASTWGLSDAACEGDWVADMSGKGLWPPLVEDDGTLSWVYNPNRTSYSIVEDDIAQALAQIVVPSCLVANASCIIIQPILLKQLF